MVWKVSLSWKPSEYLLLEQSQPQLPADLTAMPFCAGRKHQLRRHMKHILHPIVGDTKYGRGEHNRFFRERYECHRLLLHASALTFTHPETGESIKITAPLDGIFASLVKEFDWENHEELEGLL